MDIEKDTGFTSIDQKNGVLLKFLLWTMWGKVGVDFDHEVILICGKAGVILILSSPRVALLPRRELINNLTKTQIAFQLAESQDVTS